MRKISIWAKENTKKSRWIITLLHIIGGLNCLIFGSVLFLQDWLPPKWVLIMFANLFFIFYLLYPSNRSIIKWVKPTFWNRKGFDFSLLILAFLVISMGFTRFIASPVQIEQYEPKVILIVEGGESPESLNIKEKVITRFQVYKSKLQKEFDEIKYHWQTRGNGWTGFWKILLIILSLGVAIGLGYFIGALACSLSCSGQEALALIVIILGWGGLLWLLFITIKAILQKVGKRKLQTSS